MQKRVPDTAMGADRGCAWLRVLCPLPRSTIARVFRPPAGSGLDVRVFVCFLLAQLSIETTHHCWMRANEMQTVFNRPITQWQCVGGSLLLTDANSIHFHFERRNEGAFWRCETGLFRNVQMCKHHIPPWEVTSTSHYCFPTTTSLDALFGGFRTEE